MPEPPRPSASIAVALIEQVGALVGLVATALIYQHLYAEFLTHEPEKSWLRQAWHWWESQQEARWRKRLRVWSSSLGDPVGPDEPAYRDAGSTR